MTSQGPDNKEWDKALEFLTMVIALDEGVPIKDVTPEFVEKLYEKYNREVAAENETRQSQALKHSQLAL